MMSSMSCVSALKELADPSSFLMQESAATYDSINEALCTMRVYRCSWTLRLYACSKASGLRSL